MVGHKYSQEEREFLHSFVPGHTYKEIVDAYNERFEDQITLSRVKGYVANHKLNTGFTGRFEKGHVPANKGTHTKTVGRMGETQFKKGGLPPNTKPIGYERVTRDGYIEVKIKMRPSSPLCNDNFVLKHRLVWEQANGPIPKGSSIIFKDGDKQNCDISNLDIVSRKELLEINRHGLKSPFPELTEVGVLIAKSRCAVYERKKRRKKNG